MRSMTAYSRARSHEPGARWVVEIHSVNRKTLDIQTILPKEFLRFDLDVRRWISESVARGQVTVRVALELEDLVQGSAAASLQHMKPLKKTWEKIAAELGFDPKQEIDLKFLMERLPPSTTPDFVEKEEALKRALKETIENALKEFLAMKAREGKTLLEEIKMRLQLIEEAAAKVKKAAPKAAESYRKKLLERIEELQAVDSESEERVMKEVVLFAERCDISEELTRLFSHTEQFHHYLSSKEKTIGRTLDFLVQEMNREVNTIASKAQESEVAHACVLMKSELEKIREQLQNIE